MNVHLPSAAYKAMAVQKARTQQPTTDADVIRDLRLKLAIAERERDAALAEVTRLNAENDTLTLRTHRSKTNAGDAGSGTFVDGRRVVNQVEAARLLDVPQYKISRWLKARKFEKARVPGRKLPGIFADSLHKPEPGKAGRKKQ